MKTLIVIFFVILFSSSVFAEDSLIYTYLEHSRSDIKIPVNTSIWINASLIIGTGNILLFNNDTLINNGTSPLSNYVLFDKIGLFNITSVYLGNENYTPDSETWWVMSMPRIMENDTECYNDKCVFIGVYPICPENSMNWTKCQSLIQELYCGDKICSQPNSKSVNETFYNCPEDCVPPNFLMNLGTAISPEHPTTGLIFVSLLIVGTMFALWKYDINSKLNKKLNEWKRKKIIKKQKQSYRQSP